MTENPRTRAAEWGLVLLITLAAALLRFCALGDVPPGLYRDEAYNGLDALRVLDGARPIFFEANNGREPLFIYLAAASIGLVGRTPDAIRGVAALLGTLTVPAAYLLFRSLYGRAVGLLGAATLAVTIWPIQLSRIGFRAVALPLFTALALWQLWAGLQSGRARHFVVAGVVYGVSFYTYLASRFTPLALLIIFGIALLRKRPRVRWQHLALFALAAIIVVAPLGIYVVGHWSTFTERAGQVSVLNPDINGGDLWGTLGKHLLKTAAMFNLRGDFIPRHNVPLRPVFDPLMGIAFLVGLGVTLARRSDADTLALVWLGVLLLPTVLAEDAPHFLRGSAILPVAFLFPAVGLYWLGQRAGRWLRPRWVAAALAAVLVISLGWTVRDYFVGYATNPDVAFAFEEGAADLAADTNAYLRSGWYGSGYAEGSAATDRTVYLARRIWDNWPSLRYLVPKSSGLHIVDSADRAPGPTTSYVRLVMWPYEPYGALLRLLPQGSAIRVMQGSDERGDLETESRLVHVTFDASPPEDVTLPPLTVGANFQGKAVLESAGLRSGGDRLYVTLCWRDLQPMDINYMIFAHVEQPGFATSTGDGPAALGYYPTNVWRAGDWIVDERVIELATAFDPTRDHVTVGLYDLATLERLPVVDSQGNSLGTEVILNPVP